MDAKRDLLLVIVILVVLGIVWVVTGGPERAAKEAGLSSSTTTREVIEDKSVLHAAPSNQPEIRADTSVTASTESIEQEIEKVQQELEEVGKELENIKQLGDRSVYENKVSIEKSRSGVRKTTAREEYITLRASGNNEASINITGWQLESTITGKKRTIGKASYLPNSGGVNAETALLLAPGDRVVVATGRSPIGSSFRINKCTGYFEQFQDFEPRLSRVCPRPDDELEDFGTVSFTDDSCYEYVDRIPRCTMVIKETPLLSPACFNFINANIHYSGCVTNHRNDADFFKSEWRVYLGRDVEQWRQKREVIRLLDRNGKIVDVYTY